MNSSERSIGSVFFALVSRPQILEKAGGSGATQLINAEFHFVLHAHPVEDKTIFFRKELSKNTN